MKNNMTSKMGKTVKLIFIVIFTLATINLNAKSIGRFSKYVQVTDKEILVETSKGVKVLFTAFDNQSIGITYFGADEFCKLISPSQIAKHSELNGSIYVEELDELMQITTTSNNGLMIKVNKQKCGFTFVDKSTNKEMVLGEDLLAGIISNNQEMNITIDANKQLSYIAHPKL